MTGALRATSFKKHLIEFVRFDFNKLYLVQKPKKKMKKHKKGNWKSTQSVCSAHACSAFRPSKVFEQRINCAAAIFSASPPLESLRLWVPGTDYSDFGGGRSRGWGVIFPPKSYIFSKIWHFLTQLHPWLSEGKEIPSPACLAHLVLTMSDSWNIYVMVLWMNS